MRRELSYEELRNDGYRMQPMEDLHDYRDSNPKAGAIVSALGNYRRTHPIVNFQYKIGLFIKRLRYIISLFNRQDWSK